MLHYKLQCMAQIWAHITAKLFNVIFISKVAGVPTHHQDHELMHDNHCELGLNYTCIQCIVMVKSTNKAFKLYKYS